MWCAFHELGVAHAEERGFQDPRSSLRRNQERSLEVAVRPLRRSVSIERIRARSRRARFRVEPIEDSDGVRVRVTLPPQSRPGRVSDWIVIETSSSRQPRIEIPILASIE